MPHLSESSGVVCYEDQFHELASQKGLTSRFNYETLNNVMTGYMGQDVREESLYLIEEILDLHEAWFFTLEETARVVDGTNRREISLSNHSLDMASDLFDKVQQLLEQLVSDAELFTIGD